MESLNRPNSLFYAITRFRKALALLLDCLGAEVIGFDVTTTMQHAKNFDRITADPVQGEIFADNQMADTRRNVVAWRT